MNWNMYPLSAVIGYEMWERVGKDKWLAIAVTLLTEKLGEDATPELIRAEVAALLDQLHGKGQVPHSLPRRYPRPVQSAQDSS